MDSAELFAKLESSAPLSGSELSAILNLTGADDLTRLYALAYAQKLRVTGRKVFFRGLVELSNICARNCFYCGIRRGNSKVRRYRMTEDEVYSAADMALKSHFGSMVLQGGERNDPEFIDCVERLILGIRQRTGNQLGLTLSLGEQSPETCDRWFAAGAHRYLLRIEASNPALFRKLHPADQSFENRVACIDYLSSHGWQTGTGVMIGLPGQTIDDLVSDLIFFREHNIDMIGMGPYLSHADTPLGAAYPHWTPAFELSLKMIAAARLYLRDVNIASTTALHTIRPDGRELGLLAGANVIMPNLGDSSYRKEYNLYEGKASLDDGIDDCMTSLLEGIARIGEEPAPDEWGDPKHFFSRVSSKS